MTDEAGKFDVFMCFFYGLVGGVCLISTITLFRDENILVGSIFLISTILTMLLGVLDVLKVMKKM